MMLRSSSTPILGSLVSSCSDSPNNNHYHHPELSFNPINTLPLPPTHNKLSILSSNSSPISPSTAFPRAHSDTNLAILATSTPTNDDIDFSFSTPSNKFPTRHHHTSFLETIPSFSFHNSRGRFEDDDQYSDEEQQDDEYGLFPDNSIKPQGRFEFEVPNFDMEKKIMALNQQMNVVLSDNDNPTSKMFLAKGVGAGVEVGRGGGGNFTAVNFSKGGNGGEGHGHDHDVEEHYRRMVNANPGNPLYLRNYAQFLHQSKKDLHGAEEYYSRAILADPNDGEILSQYANILWELHHDKDRATSYYKRAVQAASEDSHVHAAYASFLWDVEDEDEDEAPNNSYAIPPPLLHIGAMT